MRFFENTRKPQGFGGKLMTKMMNSGHAKLSQWGFSNISAKSDAEVLDVGCGGGANIAVWLDRCRNGHVTGMDYEEYNEIMFLREITPTINALNEMADVVRLYSKKPKTAEQRLANLLSEVLYEDSESV